MLVFQLSILRRHILGRIEIGMLDMTRELFAALANGILKKNFKIQIHGRFEHMVVAELGGHGSGHELGREQVSVKL